MHTNRVRCHLAEGLVVTSGEMTGIVIGTMIAMLVLVAAGMFVYVRMTGHVPGSNNRGSTVSGVIGTARMQYDDELLSTRQGEYVELDDNA